MYSSLRGSYSSLSRESSPQSSPRHGSPRNFRSSFNSEISKSYIESTRNGFGNKLGNRDGKPLKLPPWDQASAEFYFARSRDLLTKIMPKITNPAENNREQNGTATSPHPKNNGFNKMQMHHYENWNNHDSTNNFSAVTRLLKQNENKKFEPSNNQKTNGNPSVLHKMEVPSKDNNPHQVNNVVLRKAGSRGHLRRRSYNDRYPSSTSSDSSDCSFTLSGSEKQMNHRMKMRKQRRGGSFSHQITQLKSPQYLLNSPPPQNSFLNSVTSPKSSPVTRNKFYFANFKPLNSEESQLPLRGSLNNITKPNYLSLSGYEMKWPDRARDSSSLTFTSSNSSSLNWEEYPEFDRDFLSFNNCPPSPAPQV